MIYIAVDVMIGQMTELSKYLDLETRNMLKKEFLNFAMV
jgi:hypothetical protein